MSRERDKIIDEIFNDFKLLQRTAKRGMRLPQGHVVPSMAQLEMIHIIAQRGLVTVKEIAKHMGVSGSAITQFANHLVKAGLIKREHDANDRRIVNISLSKTGLDNLDRLEIHSKEHMVSIFEPLTNEELKTLRNLHRKIIGNLANKKEQVE